MNRFEVSPGHYEFRYVDNLMHNFDYDTNMIVCACFIGFLCFCYGYIVATGKWKIRYWRSKGLSDRMTLRGNCGSWEKWIRDRATIVYGRSYAANKNFDFLPDGHWFKKPHNPMDKDAAILKKNVTDFIRICNECGCDVIIRQHTSDYDKHERYNAEQLIMSSGSRLVDTERNY